MPSHRRPPAQRSSQLSSLVCAWKHDISFISATTLFRCSGVGLDKTFVSTVWGSAASSALDSVYNLHLS